MDNLFLDVLNLSITASYVILILLLIRVPMKRLPKIFSYLLWSVAGIRLVLPFSFKGILSLFPRNMNMRPIPGDIMLKVIPRVDTGNKAIDNMVTEILPKATKEMSVNPLQIYLMIGTALWIVGICILLCHGIFSMVKLKKKLRDAKSTGEGIYEKEGLPTAFVLGFLKPMIYLPEGLSEEERELILLHEKTHIRRKDPLVKMIAFLILCLHWFNPFVWIAFRFMTEDMELSCDESVLKEMGGMAKKEYATSLLNLASKTYLSYVSPLAFSEGSVETRVKNVLKYRKPRWFLIGISLIVCVVVAIGLLTEGKSEEGKGDRKGRLRKEKARYASMNSKELGEEIEKLYKEGEIRAGFIRIEGDNLYFDEVEMISRDDKERIKELGLDEDRDLISGYYIHNEEEAEEVFKITEDSFYYFTDLETYFVEKDAEKRGYVTDDEKELMKHFGGQSPRYPVFIETNNRRLERMLEYFPYTI